MDSAAMSALLDGFFAPPPGASGTTITIDAAPSISGKQAAKAAGIAGTSITCGVVALTVFILLVTFVPIFFAMAANGGPLAPLWNSINPTSPVGIELRFGEEGIGAGQMDNPRAIAADDQGNIYVADYSWGACSPSTRRASSAGSPTWARTITSRRWKSPATALCWW